MHAGYNNFFASSVVAKACNFALLCFQVALLSSHFQLEVKPTHYLHPTTDKLSRHACTLFCPMGGGNRCSGAVLGGLQLELEAFKLA
jgi:hypothetical protein